MSLLEIIILLTVTNLIISLILLIRRDNIEVKDVKIKPRRNSSKKRKPLVIDDAYVLSKERDEWGT